MKFLGHVIDQNGVATDPDKVKSIIAVSEEDLMMLDGVTPSPKKIKSFLGMALYYQKFIPNCSSIAKPLFNLTAAPKGRNVPVKGMAFFKKCNPEDWKPEHAESFRKLTGALLESVVLAHPDFTQPFILCTDASMDGLGAVLSQVPVGETKARPIAFSSRALTHAQSQVSCTPTGVFGLKMVRLQQILSLAEGAWFHSLDGQQSVNTHLNQTQARRI